MHHVCKKMAKKMKVSQFVSPFTSSSSPYYYYSSVVTLIFGIFVLYCPLLISCSPINTNNNSTLGASYSSGFSDLSTTKSISLRENVSTENINNNPKSSYSFGRKVVLTNVKRQIGNSSENPILNLHEKVNGQVERMGIRGGQELSVTDVSPSSEFRATSLFKSNMRGNSSRTWLGESDRDGRKTSSSYSNSARPRSESNTDTTTTGAGPPASATTTETFTSDGKHSGYVNLDLKSDSSSTIITMEENGSRNRSNGSDRSFAIRKDLSAAGSSVSSPSDGTRRYKKMSVNDVYNSETSHSPGVSLPDAKTDHEDDKGMPTFSNGTGNDSSGHGGGLLRLCSLVIVNQTETNTLNDLDKWTRTLVKTSQCISYCLHRKSTGKASALSSSFSSSGFNMSLKKKGGRMNEEGGAATPPPPSEISLPIHTSRDVITNKSNENKKLLSSCQKSCKQLLPRKSTLTTGGGVGPGEPSTPRTKKNGFPEETNKREEEAEINKNPTGGKGRTPESAVSRRTPMKRAGFGLEITRSDTTGVFHLDWPKMGASSSPSSSPSSSSSATTTQWSEMPIVYSVMLDSSYSTLGNYHHRWKLIDQTVATQTQISLKADACQTLGETETLAHLGGNSSGNESTRITQQVGSNIGEIRVMAVNSEGLVEKVFSGRISCSCPVDRTDKKKDDHQRGNKFVTSGNEIKHEAYSSNEGRKEYELLDENSNQISRAFSSSLGRRTTSSSSLKKTDPPKTRKGEQMNKLEKKGDKESLKIESLSPLSPRISGLVGVGAESSWSLRMVSMVHQDSLVVTEVSWKLPSGLSNQTSDSVTRDQESSPRDGSFEMEDQMRNQKYHFLLTWEIFGGGLRGNLVTDTTSGSISLWPDTAYFIQVGLIHTVSPSSESPIPHEENTQSSSSSSSSHYPNQLEDESIIFPLSEDLLEPQVTVKSERLLVNTSQVIEEEEVSASTSSMVKMGQSSSSTSPRISGKSTSSVYKSEVREPFSFQGLSKNVSEIAMGTKMSSMSMSSTRKGNENDQSRMKSRTKALSSDLMKLRELTHSSVQQQSKSGGGGGGGSFKGSSNNGPATTTNVDGSSLRGGRDNYYHYHKHHEGYLGDSPGGASLKRLGYYGEVDGGVHHHRSSGSSSSLGSDTLGKNSSGTNGYEDKKSNINDNKSNNNLKPKITFTSSSSSASSSSSSSGRHTDGQNDHSSSQATKVLSGSSSNSGSGGGGGFRPDVYQDLFAIDSSTAFRTVPISAVGTRKDQSNDFANYNGSNFGAPSLYEQERPSAVYSIFVLVVVACVIFLFLVAIIGFFVVTSSIRTTAQYFVPKRIRVWIVGRSQDELLRRSNTTRDRDDDDGDDEEEEEFYGNSYYDEFDDRDDFGNEPPPSNGDWNGISTTSIPTTSTTAMIPTFKSELVDEVVDFSGEPTAEIAQST